MRRRWRVAGAFAAIIVLLGVAMALRPLRTTVVTTSSTAPVPYTTLRQQTDELPAGLEVVVQEGMDGRKTVFTYSEERTLFGIVLSRAQVPAGEREAERIDTEALPRIIEVGTARRFVSELRSSAEAGVQVGVIGPAGTLLIKASGVVTYMKGSTAPPTGDPSHDYTFVPLRPDVNVGSLLLRVGSQHTYVAYSELELRDGTRVVEGAPGEPVIAVVNDAPGLYEDNQGSFSLLVTVP